MAGVGQLFSKLGAFFTKYVPQSMPIFEKKSHLKRPVECPKLYLVFYVIPALNKKSSQSLCLSPRNSFGWKFLKFGPLLVHSFARKIPNLQEYRLTSLPSTGLTVKAVYEVSNSWYG